MENTNTNYNQYPNQFNGYHYPVRKPNHGLALTLHLVFLLLVEPVLLGSITYLFMVSIILAPIGLLTGAIWIGLGIWHLIASIIALVGLCSDK